MCLLLLSAGIGFARPEEKDLHRRMEQVAAMTDVDTAWNAAQELMQLPSYGKDRLEITALFVNKGFRYVQQEMNRGCGMDFDHLKDILRKMYPYAVKEERWQLREAEAYIERVRGACYSRRSEWDSTYQCLLKAYDGYAGINGSGQQTKLLQELQKMERRFVFLLGQKVLKEDRSLRKGRSVTASGDLSPEAIGKLLSDAIRDDSLHYTSRALINYLIVKEYTQKLANEGEWRIHFLSMFRAANCYKTLERYREAWDMCQELLALPLTEPEKKTTERLALKCAGQLVPGLLYAEKVDYADVRGVLERALSFAPSGQLAPFQEQLAEVWFLEGVDAFAGMKTETAAQCYREALKLYQTTGNLERQTVLLSQLAKAEFSFGNSDEAARLLDQAQTLAHQIGDESLQMDITKMQLFLARSRNDRSTYADKAYEWDIRSDSLSIQRLYYEWGDRMVAQKNYKMAEYYYDKSLSGSGSVSRDVLLTVYYSKMCNMFLEAGDYARAERYGREELLVGRRDNYTGWIRQGLIYARQGKWQDFQACYQRLEKAASEEGEPRERALIYTTRALSYEFFKEWQKAYGDLLKADSILTEHYGEADAGRVNVLSLMGTALLRMKQLDKACDAYRKGAEIARNTSGEHSLEYSSALKTLALGEIARGEKKTGSRSLAQSVQILQDYIRSELRYVSPAERESFWNDHAEQLWDIPAYAVRLEAWEDDFTEVCYNALLFSKGVLLETEKSLNQVLQEEGTPEDRNIFAEMTSLQNQITGLTRREQFSKDTLALWQARMQKLDHELSVRSKAYADYTAFLDWDYRQVKNSLKNGEVLIDFVDFTTLQKERRYAVYLIRKDRKYPLLLSLFSQKELEELLRQGPVDLLYRADRAPRLLELLWRQVQPYVSEGETVYYVPSGDVYRLALESLPADDGRLLGEHYRFVRLSSARELARQSVSSDAVRTAALYGGLQYDLKAEEMQAESRKYRHSSLWAERSVLRGDSVFAILPESGEEVRQIADILRADRYQVDVYEGSSGSEESFLNLSGHSPCLLHLATHGFYVTPREARKYDYLRGFQDAMYLSGLVLAGGNTAWLGKEVPEGVQDGILTAHDIAALDLSGTELVVLSACQTGQGQVTAEGLYGLQRAFKKAGAQTLVMTLWRVSDHVTREFMVAFYQHLIAEKGNKREAFEKTKSQIRSRYPEPFYWAGFVMVD